MAFPKKKGVDLAIVFGSGPKKPGPKKPAIPTDNEEMGEQEDDDEDTEALQGYCEAMGLSPEEFRDAVRIAMK